MRSPRRHYLTLATALGVALLAAGCASHGESGSASDTSRAGAGPSHPPSASAPSASSSAASGGASSAAGTPRCHTGSLKIATHSMGAAAGNHYTALVFTNTGHRACRAYGYPGMQLLDNTGGKLATSVVRDTSRKPSAVLVKPGSSAWSRAGWAAIPGAHDQGNKCSEKPASTEVTPPDETDYQIVKWTYGAVCQHGRIVVAPLASGTGPTR